MRPTTVPYVLIVDDEPAVRELLQDALASHGWTVRAAGSANEALALATDSRPDLVVADVRLGDGDGLELIDRLRGRIDGDLPAVVISGLNDVRSASEAARRGCVDFLTKPLDLPRLGQAVRDELARRDRHQLLRHRNRRLRDLARRLNRSRHESRHRLENTGRLLTKAYRALTKQFRRQEAAMRFQRYLLSCQTDDDVFSGLFRFFAEQGGQVFGLAMVCDHQAQLQLVGRFGMPVPDTVDHCQRIGQSLTDLMLQNPQVMRLEACDNPKLFAESLLRRLTGVSFLCMPLVPSEGELIGLVILYRKGEQPFSNEDMALAEILAPAVAMRIRHGGNAEAAA